MFHETIRFWGVPRTLGERDSDKGRGQIGGPLGPPFLVKPEQLHFTWSYLKGSFYYRTLFKIVSGYIPWPSWGLVANSILITWASWHVPEVALWMPTTCLISEKRCGKRKRLSRSLVKKSESSWHVPHTDMVPNTHLCQKLIQLMLITTTWFISFHNSHFMEK